MSEVPLDNKDDDTSKKDGCNSNESGNKGSDGKETEDNAFHCAAQEIMNQAGQRVGTAVMDWGGSNGW